MNRIPLTWLFLASVLGAYAVSIFISNQDLTWWSTASGIILAAASLVMFWKFSRELRNNRQP